MTPKTPLEIVTAFMNAMARKDYDAGLVHARGERRNILGRGIGSEHDGGRVAWRNPDDNEDHRHDEGKHDDHAPETLQKCLHDPCHCPRPTASA